jgi:hypothetical protein
MNGYPIINRQASREVAIGNLLFKGAFAGRLVVEVWASAASQ